MSVTTQKNNLSVTQVC